MSTLSPARAVRKPAPPHVLTLLIGSTAYSVTRLHPDPDVAARAVRLQKLDGETYDVRQDDDGACYCEYKGFLRWGTPCKHIRTLQAVGLLHADQDADAPF